MGRVQPMTPNPGKAAWVKENGPARHCRACDMGRFGPFDISNSKWLVNSIWLNEFKLEKVLANIKKLLIVRLKSDVNSWGFD